MKSEEFMEKVGLVDLPNQQLDNKEITLLLLNLTGCAYTFAVASDMRWGENDKVRNYEYTKTNPDGFYQLMPHTMDKGFFDWYCYYRDNQQFFETKENCVLHFIYYWLKWNQLGKPKPF